MTERKCEWLESDMWCVFREECISIGLNASIIDKAEDFIRARVEEEIRKERKSVMQTLEELRVEVCTKGDWLQGSYYDRAIELIRARGGEK